MALPNGSQSPGKDIAGREATGSTTHLSNHWPRPAPTKPPFKMNPRTIVAARECSCTSRGGQPERRPKAILAPRLRKHPTPTPIATGMYRPGSMGRTASSLRRGQHCPLDPAAIPNADSCGGEAVNSTSNSPVYEPSNSFCSTLPAIPESQSGRCVGKSVATEPGTSLRFKPRLFPTYMSKASLK